MADYQPDKTGTSYEIVLKGYLDETWNDWFEGLAFAYGLDGTTILSGEILDQASLYGLLKKIHYLGMPLLSVNHLSPVLRDDTDSSI